MGGAGVYLPAPGARVEQVIADQNCGHGFDLGDSALVIHSQAFSNAGTGIHAGLGSSVTGNSARANDSDGIQVAGDSAVTGNTAYDNGVSGIVGFGAGSVVTGNTMSHNGLWGLTGNLGYGENVLTCNHNACDNAAQVSGGLEIGANLCGTDTTCP
jgi:parallel beta-helix repeat protein